MLAGVASMASLGVMPLEDLASKADAIVYGRVIAIDIEHQESDTPAGKVVRLVATVRVDPYETLKGGGGPVIVRAVENMEDSPRFIQDAEVVLFLGINESGPDYAVIGLTQGKFDVVDGRVTREQVGVETFLDQVRALIGK